MESLPVIVWIATQPAGPPSMASYQLRYTVTKFACQAQIGCRAAEENIHGQEGHREDVCFKGNLCGRQEGRRQEESICYLVNSWATTLRSRWYRTTPLVATTLCGASTSVHPDDWTVEQYPRGSVGLTIPHHLLEIGGPGQAIFCSNGLLDLLLGPNTTVPQLTHI